MSEIDVEDGWGAKRGESGSLVFLKTSSSFTFSSPSWDSRTLNSADSGKHDNILDEKKLLSASS